MVRALLRCGDGLAKGRPWLKTLVRKIQNALIEAGLEIHPDGHFGPNTERAIQSFQDQHQLSQSGVLDLASWDSLNDHLQVVICPPAATVAEHLVDFQGDLDWLHQWEGHRGRAYWPEGASGITLDPGVDVGHADWRIVEGLYEAWLTGPQMTALLSVAGIKGKDARTALNAVPAIRSIRISTHQALEILPYAAHPYWRGITDRFRALTRQDTPPSIQTVLLSLAYNRGVFNRHLEKLGNPLNHRRWADVADLIGSMQQAHSLRGIRIRRRHEANLIRAELELLQS